MNHDESTRIPRLLLRWESLWRYAIPRLQQDQPVLAHREGVLVQAGYVVYSDARTVGEFERGVLPVVTSLRQTHLGLMLGIVAVPASFLGSRFLRLMARCREASVVTVVELRGAWTLPMLDLFVAAHPTYLRIGPELAGDIAVMPDQFRAVASLVDYLRDTGVPLVARGARTTGDLDTLRVAGVELIHRVESSTELDESLVVPDTSRPPQL